MKKVLLVGEKYSSNLGDGVIFESVRKIIISNGYKVVDFDISGREAYEMGRTMKSSKKYQLLKKIMRHLMPLELISRMRRSYKVKKNLKNLQSSNYDFIIFSGGQLFLHYFIYPIWIIYKYAKKNNIKIIINSVGFGKLNERELRMVKRIVNDSIVVGVSFRDNFDLAKMIGDKKEVSFCLDPVLELKHKTGRRRSNKIGIGIMNPQHFDKPINIDAYGELIETIVNILREQGVEYEFFTNGAEEDEIFARELLSKKRFNGVLKERPLTPKQLVNMLDNYRTIISFRMHSHIIMASAGIRTIGFIWNKKIRDFSEIIDNTELFFEINENTANKMQIAIKELVRDCKLKMQWKNEHNLCSDFLNFYLGTCDE